MRLLQLACGCLAALPPRGLAGLLLGAHRGKEALAPGGGGSVPRHAGGAAPHQPRVVWVHSTQTRTGSSTLLSMVKSAAGPGAGAAGQGARVFALFEPCHFNDKSRRPKGGCEELVRKIARCDLADFPKPYYLKRSLIGLDGWSSTKVSASCASSDVVAFKTVNDMPALQSEVLPLLNATPNLYVLEVVRDPRSIYASQKTTPGITAHNVTEICDRLGGNARVSHDRIQRVRFEDLVTDPEGVTRSVFSFLGLPFGDAQRAWINSTFNTNCTQTGVWDDCHRTSRRSVDKWRHVLNFHEFASFVQHPACHGVAEAYGYQILDQGL